MMTLLLVLVACGTPVSTVDLTGTWSMVLANDGQTWAGGVLDVTDEGTTLSGTLELGAGGEEVVNSPFTGEDAGDSIHFAVDAPDARTEDPTPVVHLDFVGDTVSEDALSGTFTAMAGAEGSEQDALSGGAGTFQAVPG